MKKIILVAALAIATTSAFAQTSKNGHRIAPESGDWGISIDAHPLLDYVGNLANGNQGNQGFGFEYATPWAITGLMYIDENTAYRGTLGFNPINSAKTTNIVDQDGSTSNPPATVEDTRKMSSTVIQLGAGIQKTRGSHRVIGKYGAEAHIGLGSGKTTYEFGNAFSSSNTTPTSTVDFDNGYSSPVGSRMTEYKQGSTFNFGVRAFIGVEYFVAPKVSLCGEYGLGIGISSTGEGEMTTEYWNGTGVATQTSKSGKSSEFNFGVDNMGGAIRGTFYF
ncbi:MAG TPA: hypothetical protein PKM16_02550 [Bacteroidia bacterium]|nr:hypothetical protein [Bacteroidia bacterium]